MTALTAHEIAARVARAELSARDVVAAALERVASGNSGCNAFLETFGEPALARAAEIDARVRVGAAVGPLAGVPVAAKDNICTRLGRTTCGSRMLADYRSPYDAAVIERLEAADAVIIGKTNLDEFAMGSSTENSAFGPTRNPCDPARVPGGSSGGSAAAVAAGFVPLALGSDTGGSIRQPAAFCGIVGLKPTYGRVSRYGLVAFGSSLDQVGPLTTCVRDAALALQVLAGGDARDTTSVPQMVPDYAAEVADADAGDAAATMRIGVAPEYFGPGLDEEIRSAVTSAIERLRAGGAAIVDVSMPHTDACVAAYYLTATAECSSNLARFDGVRYGARPAGVSEIHALYEAAREAGFGPEVKRRIMLGTYSLSAGYYDAYYLRAARVRRLVQQDFDAAFAAVDVLVCPTTPTPPFPLGEKVDDPLAMYLADVYTVPASLAGMPAISIPCGTTRGGLPIGIQFVGPMFGESLVLRAARLLERSLQP